MAINKPLVEAIVGRTSVRYAGNNVLFIAD